MSNTFLKRFLLGACVICAIGLITACGKSTPEEPPAPVKVVPTTEQKLDAIIRAHTGGPRQICYDAEHDGFFLEFPRESDTDAKENFLRGIQWYRPAEYFRAENNTWYITETNIDKYSRVYPDLTGLTCKRVSP